MNLYLMRHGAAFDIGERTVSTDEERMLTRKGRDSTAAVISALGNACRPERIWTSPLVRARETADIAARVLALGSPAARLASLIPGTDVSRVVKWLNSRRENALMLVGHMPDLSILATVLTSGVKEEGLALKKSGVCCIEFAGRPRAGCGRLMWLVTPPLLSKLSR